ncbi:hypothetical protein Tco_1265187 [Tanacetum coccineum]
MCNVPFRDNSLPLDISKDQFEGFFDSNDDSTLIDDYSFSIDDIYYVEASPLDSEPVSLEVVEIVIPEVGGIDTDILLTIKDDILLFDTLLPFSSENEDNVFNPGILASNEEKSPYPLSHRGFKASKLFHHKSPMLIHGENIPILDVPFLHFYPP